MSSSVGVAGHAEGQPPPAPPLVPGSTMSMIGDGATIQKADGNDFFSSFRDTFKTVLNFNLFPPTSSEHTESNENLMRPDAIAATFLSVLPLILEAIRNIQPQPQVGEMTSVENTSTLAQSGPDIPHNQAQLEITNVGNSSDPARTITEAVHNQEQPEAGEMTVSRALPQDSPTNHTLRRFPRHGAVDVTDIVPSNPSSLPAPTSIPDKYTRCMLKWQAGYPLYEPQAFSELSDEYLIEGIRAGDVGFIRQDGTFDFLFNIRPSHGSINPPDLPNGFTLHVSQDSGIRPKQQFEPKTHLFDKPVSRVEGLLGCHKYICSGTEGAILELPEGASQFEAINIRPFKDFAVCHGEEWYRYTMRRGRDITNGSLYLVTSSTKCTHWGIAVIMEPCAKRQGLQFVHNGCFFRNSNLKSCWKGSCASITKVAPTSDSNHLNQCIFLRGYKIMLREDIWNDLDEEQRRENCNLEISPPQPGNTMQQTAPSNQAQHHQSEIGSATRPGSRTSGPATDVNEHREDSLNPDLPVIMPPVTEGEVILHADFNVPPVHPSDLINIALLNQEPSAKLAITHDDAWCDLLRDISNSKTLDIARIAQSYTSPIDEYGCISFEKAAFNTATNAGSGEPDTECSKFNLNMSDNGTRSLLNSGSSTTTRYGTSTTAVDHVESHTTQSDSDGGKVMILCFDDAGNKFGTNSNVCRLFRSLQKGERKKQIAYYQPEIGGYDSNRIFFMNAVSIISSKLDEAIALHINDHVKKGYQFIVQNYCQGDRICLFGFSQGAHIARILAGMVYKIGILPKEYIRQVDSAFKIYNIGGHEGYTLSQEFKTTFTTVSAYKNVSVDFVGVLDTISSVGILPRFNPYTSVNYAVKKFRHALSLDERRARFCPNLWNEIKLTCEHESDSNIPVPDRNGELNCSNYLYKLPNSDIADVKEVWFAGTHTDIGGDLHSVRDPESLSLIPLRWLIKECITNETGILFDLEYLQDDLEFDFVHLLEEIGDDPEKQNRIKQYKELKIYGGDGQLRKDNSNRKTDPTDVTAAHASTPKRHQPIKQLERHTRLGDIFDRILVIVWWFWWLLRLIPPLYTYQNYCSKCVRQRMHNFGRSRYIPIYKNKVLVHKSVKEHIIEGEKGEQNTKAKYKPRAYNWNYLQNQTDVIEYVD